jgi:hypothetical protein
MAGMIILFDGLAVCAVASEAASEGGGKSGGAKSLQTG